MNTALAASVLSQIKRFSRSRHANPPLDLNWRSQTPTGQPMKMLVATDGSKHALHAVKYAANLVRLLRSPKTTVTLISVHDDYGLRSAKAFVGSAKVADYLREESEKELKPAQKFLATAGVKHDMEIRIGRVAQEIVACADAGKFDLIVLGSKGRNAVADMLLGSVAHRVIAIAKQPVLLVK